MTSDLNLLRVLDALLETGSVTDAAERLHLSPSAVSRALGRLRRELDDPLFVQVGREFQPTPRALELRGPTSSALAAAEAVLRPDDREVDAVARTFTISADDALTAALATALQTDLHAQAPGIALRFITDDDHDTALDTGAADLDLGIAPERQHLRAETLFTDRYVLAAQAANAIHSGRTLTAALRDATYVDVARNHGVRHVLAAELPTAPRTIEVSSYLAAVHLLAADGNAIAVLPATLVAGLGRPLGLRARRIGFDLPGLTVSQSWHVRNDADATHRWLRSRIRHVVGAAARR